MTEKTQRIWVCDTRPSLAHLSDGECAPRPTKGALHEPVLPWTGCRQVAAQGLEENSDPPAVTEPGFPPTCWFATRIWRSSLDARREGWWPPGGGGRRAAACCRPAGCHRHGTALRLEWHDCPTNADSQNLLALGGRARLMADEQFPGSSCCREVPHADRNAANLNSVSVATSAEVHPGMLYFAFSCSLLLKTGLGGCRW